MKRESVVDVRKKMQHPHHAPKVFNTPERIEALREVSMTLTQEAARAYLEKQWEIPITRHQVSTAVRANNIVWRRSNDARYMEHANKVREKI